MKLTKPMRATKRELAAVLFCGFVQGESSNFLLVRDVWPLTDDDLAGHSDFHLAIAPEATARLAKQARRQGLTVVLCHSHPFPGSVGPSSLDESTESDLCGRVLARLMSPLPVGALIVGMEGADGRVWNSTGCAPLNHIRVIGDDLEMFPPRRNDFSDSARVSRQVGAWGYQGQQQLASAQVGIVGAGGTGSHVAEQLAHLGVGNLSLIDPDDVEISNLSRIVGACPSDVGRKKVDVISEAVQRINPSCVVRAIPCSLLDLDYRLLADKDVIFCCTDGHGSRALLTELCFQYMVPVIDLGVEIQPGETLRAGGGVRVLRPGSWCLHCAGTLDYALVREEFLSQSQRAEELRRGYLRGADNEAVSVISLNGAVASMAVLEFCELVCGFLGSRIERITYRAERRATTSVGVQQNPHCYVCGGFGLLGLGDARPLPRRSP